MLQYIILLVLALGAFFAARAVLKSAKQGGCVGCSGSCSGCSGACSLENNKASK